jgi:hypothetical protein
MDDTKIEKRLDLGKIKKRWIFYFVVAGFFIIGLLKNLFRR